MSTPTDDAPARPAPDAVRDPGHGPQSQHGPRAVVTRVLDRAAGWTRWVVLANLVGQIAIIVTGGFVRLTGSGLGCETWPECHPGSFVPVRHAATGYHQAIEFGNRMVTFVLVVVAAATAVLVWRSARAASVRRLGLVPLVGVLVQAVLGGITVLTDLAPQMVAVHLLVSMALVALSTLLLARVVEGDGPPHRVVDPGTWTLSRVLGVLLVPVLVLGAITTGSGPHGGDDVHAERLPFDPETVARLHASAVWLFLVVLVWLLWRTRRFPTPQRVRRALLAVLGLCLLQGAVGYVQYFTGLPIGMVAVHMMLAAVFTATVSWTLLTMRVRPGLEPPSGAVSAASAT
ncbi:COX15/CtaA family protein [Luteimicrobium subarcticum]|uniref:Cytochrome c oxidase assembly protein subunit 15 n=1 Tax=Luteimicrobium subarcticum TaxID=620910 RepID=A0A2M8WWH3_9MICO|nr:COX15/CtaA family protein [Luteimicrobium subarcticum]PJI95280.1 cytochrome c oxidase assembly protein subunit 15 [Luteimicrobium subarcticum]